MTTPEMTELDKYMLDQAKIEIEHTRSWPTKILAFYIAVVAGMSSAIFTLSSRDQNPVVASDCVKSILTLLLIAKLIWVFSLLRRNHLSYLKYRNLQIQFQVKNKEFFTNHFSVPQDWLHPNEVSLGTRWQGWGFYFFITCLVTGLGLIALWT